MVGLALIPTAASQPRPSERRMSILLVTFVFSAKARFKSNRRPRKALLIGISYQDNQEYKLVGPHKDVRALRRALIKQFGFRQSEIILLLDGKGDNTQNPTRENIIRELKRFVSPKDKNTDYVFAYAGHCIQFKVPQTQEEPDGLAESLLPIDAVTASDDPNMVIFDFELKTLLVEPLGPNSRLVAIIDACKSATVLNLEHHRCNRTGSITAKARNIGRRYISDSPGVSRMPKFYLSKSLFRHALKAGESVAEVSLDTCTGFCPISEGIQSRVVCISACKDSENAYENKQGQSLIQSILKLWGVNPNPTYKELAKAAQNDAKVTRHEIRKEYRTFLRKQNRSPLWTEVIQNNPLSRWIASRKYVRRWNVQISTPHPLDVNKYFTLCGSAAR